MARYTEVDGRIERAGEGSAAHTVQVSPDARLLSEDLLDACADSDLTAMRGVLHDYVATLESWAGDGKLPATSADARPDNLLVQDGTLVPLAPAVGPRSVEEAAWDGLGDLVQVIRVRGARHPWPSATDDRTMLALLGAMAGLSVPDDVERFVRQTPEPALPAYDVPGLLAVNERLRETNAALASRAQWFEDRLNTREREMRARSGLHEQEMRRAMQQQETLRRSAEDIRRSITYRVGNAFIGPLRKVRGGE